MAVNEFVKASEIAKTIYDSTQKALLEAQAKDAKLRAAYDKAREQAEESKLNFRKSEEKRERDKAERRLAGVAIANSVATIKELQKANSIAAAAAAKAKADERAAAAREALEFERQRAAAEADEARAAAELILDEKANKSLAELTQRFTAEKEDAQFNLSTTELDRKIDALNKDANKNSVLLRDLFNQAVAALQDPNISEEDRYIQEGQLKQLKELALTEEETREAEKLQEEANSLLERMAVGLTSMAASFERFADGLLSKATFLGTLAGLALLLFDPERLKAIIDEIILFFDGLYDSIVGIINGDWSIAQDFILNNLKGVGIALGILALKFGPKLVNSVASFIRGIRNTILFFNKIGKFIGSIGKSIGNVVTKNAATFSKIGGVLKNIFTKMFLPITVILSLFAAVKGAIAGFQEGGIIGGIKGAITGLFTSLIGGLLDMIKGAVSWLLGIFGFENAAEALNSFSFSELFATVIDKIFSFVGNAIEWIKGVFSNIDIGGMLQSLWDGLVAGAGTIFDIVSAPVNAAINWIKGIFTFTDTDLESDFSLSEMISNITDKIFEFFSNMFDFLPSFDDIGNKFNSLLPSWLGGEEELEEEENNTPSRRIYRTLSSRDDFLRDGNLTVGSSELRQLPSLDSLRNPNLVQTAPDTGVLRNTNDMMNNAAAARQANNVAIVNAGTTQRNSNVNNSASTYNISAGISADDFVRRDFINGY